MANPFDVCWDRIARANAHREASASAWNAYIEDDSYEPRLDMNPDGTGCLSFEQVKPIPPSIALSIGELLYQFRAALDASIYEVSCANSGQRPPPDEAKLEFPICETEKHFRKSGWKIEALTQEQRAIIESLQPYNTPSTLKPEELPYNFNRGLGLLHDWARIDRHRRIHVVGSWTANIQPMFRLPSGTSITEGDVVTTPFMLKDGGQIARFKVRGWKTGMNIQANPNVTIDMAIDEIPLPCHNVDTLNCRFTCIQLAVSSIVNNLARTVGVDGTNYVS